MGAESDKNYMRNQELVLQDQNLAKNPHDAAGSLQIPLL
jgi:hypothetical protein